MAFKRFTFTKFWTDKTHFPSYEDNEDKVRTDMQELHDQSAAGLNALMDDLEAKDAAASIGARGADGQTASTVQERLNLLNGVRSVSTVLGDDDTTIPTSKAVSDAMEQAGYLPSGGASGAMMTKTSDNNYEVGWTSRIKALLDGLNGLLRIEGSAYPTLELDDLTKGRTLRLRSRNGHGYVLNQGLRDDLNQQGLQINPESGPLSDAIQLYRRTGSQTATLYPILHTGNTGANGVLTVLRGTYTGTGSSTNTFANVGVPTGFTPLLLLFGGRWPFGSPNAQPANIMHAYLLDGNFWYKGAVFRERSHTYYDASNLTARVINGKPQCRAEDGDPSAACNAEGATYSYILVGLRGEA